MSKRTLALALAVIALSTPVIAAEPSAPPAAPAPAAAPPAAAPTSADPAKVVAYRQLQMEAAGKHMKATTMILKGEVARPGDLPGHAAALHATAVGLADLFPAGTDSAKVKTEAKAEIWSQPDKFKQAAAAFELETQKLVDVSKSGDTAAYQQQFGAVGKSCGACHDGFRVKD